MALINLIFNKKNVEIARATGKRSLDRTLKKQLAKDQVEIEFRKKKYIYISTRHGYMSNA